MSIAKDNMSHYYGCGHQAVRARSSASNAPRVVAEREAIEWVDVKSLAGWSARYVLESLLREAATRLQDRFLFGSDYPFITRQRWMKDFEALKIEFKPEVREKLFWKNGQKLLAHSSVAHMHFSSQQFSPDKAFFLPRLLGA